MGSLKFVFLLSIVGADNWDLTGNKNCYLEDYPFRLGSYEADSRAYCYLRSQNTDAVYEFQQTVIWQVGGEARDIVSDYLGTSRLLIATTWSESLGSRDHEISYYIETEELPVSCDISWERQYSGVVTDGGTFLVLKDAAWLNAQTFPSALYSAGDTIDSQTYSDSFRFISETAFLVSFVQK